MAIELSTLTRRLLRSKIAWLIGGYTGFWLINRFTIPYTECITDNWCISSRDDIWVMSLLPVALVVLILIGARFGGGLALAMLNSKRRHWYTCGFFVGLASIGSITWFLVVPPGDRLEFIHIPILGAVFAGLGFLMLWGLNPNRAPRTPAGKRKSRR